MDKYPHPNASPLSCTHKPNMNVTDLSPELKYSFGEHCANGVKAKTR